jgi:hypothetical protein
MSIVDDKSIFMSMKQDGPMATGEDISITQRFNQHAREWARAFDADSSLATKYRSVRSHIFDLLQVDSYRQILQMIENEELARERSSRAYMLLANLYGIHGELDEIKRRIREYANSADQVIDYLKGRVLADYSSNIEISNEIEAADNPVDLLLISFNNRYHKKARFEAKRKLVLMGLAASIDQREQETDIENKFSSFLKFLNSYVWSPDLKIGQLKNMYLLSTHEPGDYKCSRVTVLEDVADPEAVNVNELERLTLIKRRLFKWGDRDIPAYVTVRKKDSAAKILKLLRKNEKNPAVAVDDELGLMAVLDNVADVKMFVRHLTQAAVRAGSVMVLEDISDTLTGGSHNATSEGSSSNTQMLKFFARLGGMRVEFIIHTNQTYLNYRYQRDIAHEEYEVKRVFDTGVAEFLFPQDIYSLDMNVIREKQLIKFRSAIEGCV